MPGERQDASAAAPLKPAAIAAPPPEVIAIGLSAGGLAPLLAIFHDLEALPAAVLVCQHLQSGRKSYTAELLGRVTAMRVKSAEDGEPVLPGIVYMGPADFHLTVARGRIRLQDTAPVHHQRPSIDLTFASLAREYGARGVAVVLSGSMKDGAEGVRAVRAAGGITVAEAPADADFPSMPEAAIATGCTDYVVPIAELGGFLRRLCTGVPPAA